jgi:molybdenum cofactor biosynthesis enzyme MoaA
LRSTKPPLLAKDFVKIISYLTTCGIKGVRLTGGEPLLYPDLFILVDLLMQNGLNDISLVTNGNLLNYDNVKRIKKSGIKRVTVSLDTVDREIYAEMVGHDCLIDVLSGIDEMIKNDILLQINSVISKMNIGLVEDLIEYAKIKRVDIKLLDLVVTVDNHLMHEYVPLNTLRESLKLAAKYSYCENTVGNLGTPMDIYQFDHMRVITKDNTLGTCYSDMCTSCGLYPCQSGVVSLILTHDGILKHCNQSSKLVLDLSWILEESSKKDHTEEKQRLSDFISIFRAASFRNEWYVTFRQAR